MDARPKNAPPLGELSAKLTEGDFDLSDGCTSLHHYVVPLLLRGRN